MVSTVGAASRTRSWSALPPGTGVPVTSVTRADRAAGPFDVVDAGTGMIVYESLVYRDIGRARNTPVVSGKNKEKENKKSVRAKLGSIKTV